jgi:integrase
MYHEIGIRRSILHDAPSIWVGWNEILRLHERAVELDRDEDTPKHSLYFTTIFETGGRLSECMLLQPTQFKWIDKAIKVEHMEVFKQRKKRRFTRNVIIKRDANDPLAEVLLEHVKACTTKYLLPGYGSPFSKTIDPERHASHAYIYNKIIEISPDIWCHWLRDQRSWHLSAPIEQGGRGFDVYLLKAWFAWKSMEMPAHYAGRREEREILDAFGLEDC